MTSQVAAAGFSSDHFEITHSVKQGCAVAPTWFTMFLSVIMEGFLMETIGEIFITTCLDGKLFDLRSLKVSTKINQVLCKNQQVLLMVLI